ncbi:AraC family transcriptional activator of pobA [Chryseobacterium sp. SORGH_AS909]|uniref:AraC family transcriptional activator of pobA n=2 Tax=Chryseobacterium group TaxID=2782232 RepID=A0ABU0TFV4_9FLAO|nr:MULTISPECIES: helix-turn-helix domain-containing protein [unclassified Chryseobacterium]MDQ1095939.1 AraC family transcriptional activator of pobA [Chryseobacterium camelliae]MDR6131595.1 AraC family transcriptional activator of pobA [Chryseobacterium sp. SORGH_AS_1175]MDT3406262.1 AraC family transcriptional activator of pobA [Pseudacidovorax intermedius]MDQ1099875.1 AraC family transcriptional activator of pobA [Chryseobacterium sp. SORGH_AS_1048]MDR6087221.1 AraC family transcriptional a
MYIITDQLRSLGFSVNKLNNLISRNNHIRTFNTLDYFCIYIIMEDIRLEVENMHYSIKSGHIAFIGPHKQVTFGEALGEEIYIIVFSSSFYERSSKDSLFLNSQLFFNYNSEIFIAPFTNLEEKRAVFMERMESFQLKDESLYISAAHNAIERLILDAFLHIPADEMKKDIKFDYLYYVNRFKVLLQRDFRKAKKVSHYAGELNISSRKLTEMTEYVLGKTAKHIIIEKIVSECKKAVHFSNQTISEISYELGFSNEGNFSNFIKKHTGKNPSEMK